ncbi:hypothetical protein [Novosphingobium album (ex Hu et al. 2023)]|uniref:DUF2336 domain-containing protein n=1 Tax=Novosphingobium album (ex Hu et al. 2023) TaxID=2930093 RepID=A0ABT0AYG9_9SPHN|nr:hypothetical protein [Novosphingobium album (ex Hu et al. 2023)]MCJ2177851.1 hypothetical protein [Novosphingobium album (ex Hu et al. 2023)]
MIDKTVHPASGENVEAVLRDELARGDAMAETVLPILRHLVAAEDSSVFSDEILARVRGMMADIAGGLLGALSEGRHEEHIAADVEQLASALTDNPALLTHVHALALEWHLTERMQTRLTIDPVVSPLLQALVASSDPAVQGLAMTFLAAQARWCQAQRRMMLPLRELPGDLFHTALLTMRAQAFRTPDMTDRAVQAEAALRQTYDEGASRMGLAARLMMGLGNEAQAALSVADGGVALFLTALSLRSGQARDDVVLSTHKAQIARLALALRAAGLEPSAVEGQFMALHPDVTLPPGFDRIGADFAASLLASGRYSR